MDLCLCHRIGKSVPVWWHNFANAMARVVHFLQNVLHFLEQIFPFTSSFILQHEPSVLLYPQQPGKELAVGIFIRVQSPATERERAYRVDISSE